MTVNLLPVPTTTPHRVFAAKYRTECRDVVRLGVPVQAAQVIVHIVILDAVAELPLLVLSRVAAALPVIRGCRRGCHPPASFSESGTTVRHRQAALLIRPWHTLTPGSSRVATPQPTQSLASCGGVQQRRAGIL